jgi:predicted ATPase
MQVRPYLKAITIEKPEEGGNSFPFTVPAIRNLDYLEFHRDVTFLVGENGSGKSTILEAIASLMQLGAQGGSANFAIKDRSGQSGLEHHMRARRSYQKPRDKYFLRAESFYNVSTYLEDLADDPDAGTSRAEVFKRYGGKSLHLRSHGEAFMNLLVDAFGGQGLYVLDEPEAALSPTRQLAALGRIDQLVRKESQFIIATHSPILMAYPKSRIYLLDETGCREVAFEETEHYRVTRDFLNNYPKRMKSLLSDKPLLDLLDEDKA